MEASAFDAGIPAAEGDPFGGDDGMGNFLQDTDPLADDPLPVVDREGEVLDGAGGEASDPTLDPADGGSTEAAAETDEERQQREAAEASAAEADADFDRQMPDPSPAPASAETQAPPQEAPPAAPAASAPAAAPSPTPASATESGDGNGSEASGDGGQAAEDPTLADGGGAESSVEPGAAAGSDDTGVDMGRNEEQAPPPKESKTHRHYRLFVPEGTGKYAEVSWYEDKKGVMVPKGTDGARKQTICVARGQDEALAMGYAALGSPDDGVKLVAIADTYWNVRHVAPDPVPPQRRRLTIK